MPTRERRQAGTRSRLPTPSAAFFELGVQVEDQHGEREPPRFAPGAGVKADDEVRLAADAEAELGVGRVVADGRVPRAVETVVAVHRLQVRPQRGLEPLRRADVPAFEDGHEGDIRVAEFCAVLAEPSQVVDHGRGVLRLRHRGVQPDEIARTSERRLGTHAGVVGVRDEAAERGVRSARGGSWSLAAPVGRDEVAVAAPEQVLAWAVLRMRRAQRFAGGARILIRLVDGLHGCSVLHSFAAIRGTDKESCTGVVNRR